jgi:hypothetical protein
MHVSEIKSKFLTGWSKKFHNLYFVQYYLGDKMEAQEMGGTCSTRA